MRAMFIKSDQSTAILDCNAVLDFFAFQEQHHNLLLSRFKPARASTVTLREELPMTRHHWKSLLLLLVLVALIGCLPPAPDRQPDAGPLAETVDPAQLSQADAIVHYIRKLPDRDYVQTYGGKEHPRIWYSAAEALGALGKPAVPALVERLDTADPYELKLVVYALMLASQDPLVTAETGGEYLSLDSVLTVETNAENRRRAQVWWQRYRHLWQ